VQRVTFFNLVKFIFKGPQNRGDGNPPFLHLTFSVMKMPSQHHKVIPSLGLQIKGFDANRHEPAPKTYYVVRKPHNVDELEALLKLRYQVFRQSDLAKYVPENALGIDVDKWDDQAHHLGLWSEDIYGVKAVGYLRVIGKAKTEEAHLLNLLVEKHPILKPKLIDPNKCSIRFLEVFKEVEAVKTWFQELVSKGESVVEASRLSISPDLQHKLSARGLIETALAVFFNHQQATFSAMEVMDRHVSYYQHYGFKSIASRFQADLQRTSYLIASHYSALPDRLQERFKAIRTEWENTGSIYLN